MTKKRLKKISLMGILCLLLACCIPTMSVNAASKAKTATKKVTEVNKKYGKIKVESYYKKVVLKGNSKAVKKINKEIQKDCTEFLKGTDLLVDYAKQDSKYCQYPVTYSNTAVSKVTYNKNGIISIKITTEWYAGGTSNTDEYGMTFSLKTGKKLRLDQVCADKPAKVASTLKKKILSQDSSLDVSKITKNNVKNLDFYLKPGKKAVVCFGPYELGWGGWVRTYTVKSKYK